MRADRRKIVNKQCISVEHKYVVAQISMNRIENSGIGINEQIRIHRTLKCTELEIKKENYVKAINVGTDGEISESK